MHAGFMAKMPRQTGKRAFIVAVRRERRADIPANWIDIVRGLENVTVEPVSASPYRIVVHATAEAAADIQETLQDMVWVEESIPHSTAVASRR